MDLGALKSQVMTMFMMGGDTKKIYSVIYTMLVMSAIEYVFRHLPTITTWAQEQWAEHSKKYLPVTPPLLTLVAPTEEITASITLVQQIARTEGGKSTTQQQPTPMSERVDAVMDYICGLDAAKHVRIDGRMAVANEEEIPLTPLIKAKVKKPATADEGAQIVLYSTRLPISQLRNWLDDLYERYVYEKSNRLGNKTYYFNEIPTEPPKELDPATKVERYRMAEAPRRLNFTMNEFRTSKSFSNVYGTHVADLKERLDLFTNHPEWYMERGIPHSLGVLLHGLPGAGKTSTIKAIAADTSRHIFNLSLRAFTTQKQLDHLFYNEMVYVQDEGALHIYRIPLNKRVYVIEDIDCLTDVVRDREFFPREEPKDNRITLSYLLNLLDGVLETPGRILIITTNFPENLDRALVRPGRIDVRIEFKHADRALIAEMVSRFYETTVAVEDIPAALDGVLTPAEVMECLCTYFRDRAAAMAALEKKAAAARRPATPPKSAMTVEDALVLSAPPPTISIEEVIPAPAPAPAVEEKAPKLMISEEVPLNAVTAAANQLANQPNRFTAEGLKNFYGGGYNAPATLAPPDPGIYALFKRFEHATTDAEFEAAHKLANTFTELEAFDPDAA